MTQPATKISRQFPSYLGQSLSPRYAQVRARMLEDEKRLLIIEYRCCLKAAMSKKELRRIHNLPLLRHRLHYLARFHGETIGNEVFAMIERERYFREARFALRKLRKQMKEEAYWASYSACLDELRKAMRRGSLTNRDIRTTVTEIKSFERRRDELLAEWRQKWIAKRVRQSAHRSS